MLWLWLLSWGCLLLSGLSLLFWAPPPFGSWSSKLFLWTQTFYSFLLWSCPHSCCGLVPILHHSSHLAPWPIQPYNPANQQHMCIQTATRGRTSPVLDVPSYPHSPVTHMLLICPHECVPGHGSIYSLDSHLDNILDSQLTPSWSPDRSPAFLRGRGKGAGFKAIHILKS